MGEFSSVLARNMSINCVYKSWRVVQNLEPGFVSQIKDIFGKIHKLHCELFVMLEFL